jgi:hypothetical protein
MNNRKTFLSKVNTKTLYLVALFALAAVVAAGFLLVPTNTNTVSAQDNVTSAPANQVPNEVLTAAVNFGSATGFAVFAEKDIKDNGYSKFGGDVGVRSGGEIKGLSSGNVKGMLRSGASAEGTFKDFRSSFNYVNQLPCTEVTDSNLGGKTFTPGIYCLSSADLAGEVVLNSDDANGIFIFRVDGSLTAQSGSGMQLMNEAKAYNVFFLTNDSATVGEGSNFRGSILAKNNINVRSGASVTGRTLSLNGSVELENASVALQTGFLQICKTANGFVDANSNGGIANGGLGNGTDANTRVFTITVGGQTVRVPVGACSRPIELASGPQTIVEDLFNTNLAGGDARNGRFILTSVTLTRGPGSLGAVNLPARMAVVNIPPSATPGTLNNETVVTLNNQFAVTALVEICKQAEGGSIVGGGSGTGTGTGTGGSTTGTTGGIFEFRIDGVTVGNGQPAPFGTPAQEARFFAPVGGCTGLISVPIAVPGGPLGAPVNTSVDVREIQVAGNTFVGAFTIPADRLIAVNTSGSPVLAPTRGTPPARNLAMFSVRAAVVEGSDNTAAANQTTIVFINRTESVLKICKIAGPGVPVGTLFTFNVNGTNASTPATPTMFVADGTTGPNNTGQGVTATPMAGATNVDSTVTVPAGPADTGGFCVFAPGGTGTTSTASGPGVVGGAGPGTGAGPGGTGATNPDGTPSVRTFAAGTRTTVTETGVVGDPTPTNGQQNIDGVTGNVQVARIRFLNDPTGSTTSASTAGVVTTAPDRTTVINTNARSISFITLPGVNTVEFVNFIFNAGQLKVCKVADDVGTLGQPFTFDVVTGRTGAGNELLPDTTRTFTVQAGPRFASNPGGPGLPGEVSQNGFCVFVGGPFTGTGQTGGTATEGRFNLGTDVTVTEREQAGFRLVSVTSPTAGTNGFSTTGRSGTLTGANGVFAGTSEIVFTNAVATLPTPTATPTATPVGPGASPTPTATRTPGASPTATATASPGPTVVPPLRPRRKSTSRMMSSF